MCSLEVVVMWIVCGSLDICVEVCGGDLVGCLGVVFNYMVEYIYWLLMV